MKLLPITSPGVTISAAMDGDYIFIIRLAAFISGHGDGSRAIEKIKGMGHPIKLISVADFPELQSNLDRFYLRHGFVKDGNYMIWRLE